MNLTPQQSHYVLKVLMTEGRVRTSQVERALRGREAEIRSLKEKLASLEAIGTSDSGGRSRSRGRASRSARPARRRRMSARVRALRRLQGKYMVYVRRLKPAENAGVREAPVRKGMAAAIRLASAMAAKA